MKKKSLLNLIIGGRPDSENLPSSGHYDWFLIPELFAIFLELNPHIEV